MEQSLPPSHRTRSFPWNKRRVPGGAGLETYTAPGGYFLPAGKEASHDRTATGQDVITGGCNSATTWDGSPALPENDQGLLER